MQKLIYRGILYTFINMTKFNEQYWQNRYEKGQIGWDIGFPSTPIKAYIDQLVDKNIAVLIPGSGNAYEAEYLLEKGFNNITIIDISREAINQVRSRLGEKINYVLGDFFDHIGKYDLIIEQTFFCAIDHDLRKKYVDKMEQLLSPNGKLVGLLWDAPMNVDKPPFGGSQLEYTTLFSEKFQMEIMEPAHNSIAPRMGTEIFIKFLKKG